MSAPAPFERSEKKVRAWDIVLIIALLAAFTYVMGFAAFAGLFVGAEALGCGSECDRVPIDIGTSIAVIGPLVIGTATIVITIIRLVRRKRAWWIPLAGLPVLCLPFVVGTLVARLGVA